MSEKTLSDLRREEVATRVMLPNKSARTKFAILNAASQFLKIQPFRDLEVGILMADAGYSRPTFYQYFHDLHDLMETLLDEVKDAIIEGAQPWLSGKTDPSATLQLSLTALVDVGYERGFILKAVADAAPGDARLEQVWEAFLDSFDEVVALRIAQDQINGVTPHFDPYPVACALNRMDAGILISSFGRVQKAEKNDVLSAILRIWMSTIYPFETKLIADHGKIRPTGSAKPQQQE